MSNDVYSVITVHVYMDSLISVSVAQNKTEPAN